MPRLPAFNPAEELKPSVITCGGCGGELHVYPYKVDLGKRVRKGKLVDYFEIKTINICHKCTFGIDKPLPPNKALEALVEKFSR